MQDLVRSVFYLLSLRMGPQHLPHSPVLLAASIGAYVFASALTMLVAGIDGKIIPIAALMDVGLVVLWCWMLLMLKSHVERLMEVLTSIFAAWVPLQLGFLAIAVIFVDSETPAFVEGLAFGVLVWSLVVMANAFRHALPTSWVPACLFAVGYFFMNIQVLYGLFGDK